MVSDSIAQDGMSNSTADPCGICHLGVKANPA